MTERTPYDLPWLTRSAQRWYERRTLGPADVPSARELVARKQADGMRVSVALPALDEEATVGQICASIREHLTPLVDELVVLDGGSSDGTAEVARAAGATVVDVATVMPEIPAVRGKGEALWRSLSVLSGDIVCWIDADIRNFSPHFVSRLVAPLITDPTSSFAKAFYRRPIAQGDAMLPEGGGRVTELLARPMLNMFFPELAGFIQPLSGEYAGRRDVLMNLPFMTGYSVEVGLLIDLLDEVGLDALVQIDLGKRMHRNRPLGQLTPMATSIARTILRRAEDWERLRVPYDVGARPLLVPTKDELEALDIDELERPPLRRSGDDVAVLP
jgi:glucosyl-3-phosphoglycerate synthase